LIVEIEARLRRSPWLIVDLTAVTFIDCAGLGTLAAARSRAMSIGGGLALVGASARTSRILELTSLDQVLRVYPDLSTAEASLTARS
jgi:anti-sigma B factor antagonist